MADKLIGKYVTITAKESWACGEWGIVKMFDGELYHVAIYGDESLCLVFYRNEFRCRRTK